VLILDGTLLVTNRLPERAFYAGKHTHYGVTVQQVTAGAGTPPCSSPGRSGGSHDLTAIRATGRLPTPNRLTERGVLVLADKADQGIGHGVLTPDKGRGRTPPHHDANRAHAATRSIGERGFATENNWRILRRYRAHTDRVAHIVTAVRVLESTR
jgi:hypothetical protein